MLTIGLCDDQPQQVRQLLRHLNDYMEGLGDFQVISSTKPVDFLEKIEAQRPDIAFLDVNMGEMDGIRLGEKIRTKNPDVMLVYVTAFSQYALDAFGVRAFHYLLKPVEPSAFNAVMDEMRGKLDKRSVSTAEKHFAVRVKGEIALFPYREIRYFEKMGHCVVVHADGRDFTYYGNILSLNTELESESFAQCHQGYVVNLDKVRAFRGKTVRLEGGTEVPVGRSYAEHLKAALIKRLFEREVRA